MTKVYGDILDHMESSNFKGQVEEWLFPLMNWPTVNCRLYKPWAGLYNFLNRLVYCLDKTITEKFVR